MSAVQASPSRTRRHTRSQAGMPAIVSPALASGSKSGVGPASPAFNPGNSASLHVQNALAQSEDLLGLADTVLNMNASVQHLSLHLEAIRSVAASLPRSETSESAVSTTEQLEILQSLSRDHAAIYAHAAKLKLITESPEAILANLETSSALRSTLARITTLDEAARAEISLLSTFRRFETLTKRVLQAPISSSASVHPMIQEATQLVHVALSELKAQLLGQLHGRVQQLLQEEIDGFSRTVRAVLEGGLRALHEPGQRAAPQPESAPLDFLLGDMPLAASAGDTSIDSATAFDHSRALNENLRNRLDGGSVLLNAVAVTVGNAASRLGARVNAWASGLRQVYEKLGNATAASKEAATSSTDSGLERITELTKLYRSSAQSAVETLLDELVKQITWQDTGRTSHHDETDNERRQRVSAQAVFSYKVVDRLLKTRAVLSALSIQASSRPETAAADEDARRLEGALQRTRQRCLQSWHDIAVDRALAEFAFASTSEEDGGKSEAGTSAPGEGAGSTPPYALLRAMESLKQSVYELGGLSRARTGGDDLGGQKPLLSALLARLGSEPQELELVKASQVKAATRWLSSRDIDERLSDPAAGLF
ncbi:hypothetical protein V8E36_002431 [Tilletia maclaganii]